MNTPDNALKTLAQTDDELRVGNYMILFGGADRRDLSPWKNGDGSKGEFFSEKTAFESDYTATGTIYVDWEHGREKGIDPQAPGPHDILGRVDWKSARVDKIGLWVERVLDRRNKYVKYLEGLIQAGMISNSSQAIAEQVEVKSNGEVSRWPLMRDTLTVNPMEPRMMTANVITALKALDILPEQETAGEGEPVAQGAAEPIVAEEKTQPVHIYTTRAVETLLAQRNKHNG